MNLSFFTLKYLSLYNMTYPGVLDTDRKTNRGRSLNTPYINIPESLDWREYGVVGPVHNQGSCNACWAFSAAGSIEYHVRRIIKDSEVSVQNILDCSPRTYGCQGGLMEHVFEYKQAFSLAYSYSGTKGKCDASKQGAHVESFVAIEENIENSLPYMITKWGPVSVGVDFSSLVAHRGGIIGKNMCGSDAKHAVLVVGFTPDVWIVKNSAGTDWGNSGYALLRRGENACAVDNSYAAVATKVNLL